MFANAQNHRVFHFDFYGNPVNVSVAPSFHVPYTSSLSNQSVQSFYSAISSSEYEPIVEALTSFREQHQLDDWLYYQLIRATAERISPKAENYHRYTLYKWFLLLKSGYASTLSVSENKLLLYVQSDEAVYNIPGQNLNGKNYVCLNYHDYNNNIDFSKEQFSKLLVDVPATPKPFSYKINRLPDFDEDSYEDKELRFEYYQTGYNFKVKLNRQVKKIFANYPVVEYESYFNIPLSNETYSSLIPLLKENIKRKSQKDGIDYLMRFTRYAFLFETDTKVFGAEKRLSPEQTLLSEYSDCEDRAALFFYLVKEIYNLPMIVLSYPDHITIAVGFDKPIKNPIVYNGNAYWVCEPTPQKRDLRVGQLLPSLRKQPYEVVYAYHPSAVAIK